MRLWGCISPVLFVLSDKSYLTAHSSIRLTKLEVFGSKYLGQKIPVVVKGTCLLSNDGEPERSGERYLLKAYQAVVFDGKIFPLT